VSDFLWLVFAAVVVFAAVQLAMWMLEWVLEERGRRRPSPDHVARRLRS
jgi:hypothetical protein